MNRPLVGYACAMKRKPLLTGVLFGIIAPPVGMFVGLQVSPVLANILMFPILIVSMVTGTPLGDMSIGLWLSMIVLSGLVWALVFAAVAAIWSLLKQ